MINEINDIVTWSLSRGSPANHELNLNVHLNAEYPFEFSLQIRQIRLRRPVKVCDSNVVR